MTKYILSSLLFIGIFAFFLMCMSSIEPFTNMRPWFGYEPGIYGPGWGRKGCSNNKSCTKL